MVNIPISAPARLDGQIALVTGAGGGIGSEVVRSFVAVGATVIATDIGETNPFENQPNIHYVRYDVTSNEQTEALVSQAIDILPLSSSIFNESFPVM